ncbi:hypothetical protein [Maribacter sp.]|uniref:DUF7822 domain-containing protein n=1 Tax=Maribacter sp. TaxID=1897614 RepID=UPI003297ED05
MANRAYLYSGDKELKKLRDLSESGHPIPLIYKIVLGCDTKMTESRTWEYDEAPIAIQGDFKKGIEKLYQFLDYLKTQPIDVQSVDSCKNETIEFFSNNPDRQLDLFFLEAGEIFSLTGDIEPIGDQNKWLFNEINKISEDISEILKNKPENVFEAFDSYWLKTIKEDIEVITPYWTHVVYNSFNKS